MSSFLGTIFDNTYEEGRQPLEIEIGASGIKGWDVALVFFHWLIRIGVKFSKVKILVILGAIWK